MAIQCPHCQAFLQGQRHSCFVAFYQKVPIRGASEANRFSVYLADLCENLTIHAYTANSRRTTT